MRPTPNPLVEQYRVKPEDAAKAGPFAARFGSTTDFGNNGLFLIPDKERSRGNLAVYFSCIVSDGEGWEHCSVSLRTGPKNLSNVAMMKGHTQTPSWEQMCVVKALFWGPEEVVVQYHPKESEYVNLHPGVLHLWRPSDVELPAPPKRFV